ncbi:ATP-binding protein, partial [Oleiphilus sp. HI0132]
DSIQNIFYPMISGRAEGTGLGLSITQSIFTKHDGLVECESKPGKTDFIIYIPIDSTRSPKPTNVSSISE